MERCKAIIVNPKGIKPLFRQCKFEAVLEGYCVVHYNQYILKKNKKR
jgi:hypothetical protein